MQRKTKFDSAFFVVSNFVEKMPGLTVEANKTFM
jgi:hypothetical protein